MLCVAAVVSFSATRWKILKFFIALRCRHRQWLSKDSLIPYFDGWLSSAKMNNHRSASPLLLLRMLLEMVKMRGTERRDNMEIYLKNPHDCVIFQKLSYTNLLVIFCCRKFKSSACPIHIYPKSGSSLARCLRTHRNHHHCRHIQQNHISRTNKRKEGEEKNEE